jgi:hypothetical protein
LNILIVQDSKSEVEALVATTRYAMLLGAVAEMLATQDAFLLSRFGMSGLQTKTLRLLSHAQPANDNLSDFNSHFVLSVT